MSAAASNAPDEAQGGQHDPEGDAVAGGAGEVDLRGVGDPVPAEHDGDQDEDRGDRDDLQDQPEPG